MLFIDTVKRVRRNSLNMPEEIPFLWVRVEKQIAWGAAEYPPARDGCLGVCQKWVGSVPCCFGAGDRADQFSPAFCALPLAWFLASFSTSLFSQRVDFLTTLSF